MSPIVQDPQDVRARYANRLARQQYHVQQVWRANQAPGLSAIVARIARQRIKHRDRTGWWAAYDGETTTYHHTNPKTRGGETQ